MQSGIHTSHKKKKSLAVNFYKSQNQSLQYSWLLSLTLTHSLFSHTLTHSPLLTIHTHASMHACTHTEGKHKLISFFVIHLTLCNKTWPYHAQQECTFMCHIKAYFRYNPQDVTEAFQQKKLLKEKYKQHQGNQRWHESCSAGRL